MPKPLTWSREHIKKYLWLYRYLTDEKLRPAWLKIKKQLDEDNYINQISINTLVRIIERNANWGNSSKESLFFMLARYLQIHKPDSGDIKYLQEKGFSLKSKREEIDAENKLDEKEEENWKEQQYFRDILDNFNMDDIKTQRDHQKWLLLNLLLKTPPLRTNFYYTAKLARNYNEVEDKKNYILLIFQGHKRAYYVVGNDKVSNTKMYSKDDSLNYIEIENKELVNIIYKSFEDYPREYLFENDKKQPISDKTLLTYLKEITQVKGITMDIMRSSYISDFHKHNKRYIQHLKLAKQMRHTVETSNLRYKKIAYEDENQVLELKKRINELEDENKELKKKIKELEK